VIALVRCRKSREFVCVPVPVKLSGIPDASAYARAVAVHVLRCRMRHDIRSPFKRAAVHRRRECIVYDQRHAMRMGCLGEFFEITYRQGRIGNRLAEDGFCIRAECRLQFFLRSIRRYEGEVDSHFLHRHIEEIERASVD